MKPLHLTKPGLFITATDTGVGKTVVTCAIAAALQQTGMRVGVCKPIATGCRSEREGLVSEDAEALAHFSNSRLTLDEINPVRYHPPLAPAVAAERSGKPVDFEAIAVSLRQLDRDYDVTLIEGIGGIMVPLDEKLAVIDMIKWIGYPALVVTRAGLGTLNHTAMTCSLLRRGNIRIAGLAINRYCADTTDLAESTNPAWLAKQNGAAVVLSLPELPGVEPHKAMIPTELLAITGGTDWAGLCGRAVPMR